MIYKQNGTTLTYPPTSSFTISSPSTTLSSYSFGRRFNDHKFCPICGVSMYIHKKDTIDADEWKRLKGDADPSGWRATVPVNLRCFEGVEWDGLREKGLIGKWQWGKLDPAYVVPE
jgi:hypothetical protein